MSKWRPSDNCLYVIPDIHGMADQLKLILSRILPLRKTGGHKDIIVFLGDYIDRRVRSPDVIDIVKKLKDEYQDQTFLLKGNHEAMILNVIDPKGTITDYNMWMHNGGEETLIGYLKRVESDVENPFLIKREYISRFIPDDHIKFFKSLLPYYETDEYIFVHGGCDPLRPLSVQNEMVLFWDRSVYKSLVEISQTSIDVSLPWAKTIVTGHNSTTDGKPFVYQNFMMLDGSYAGILYVWELNSRTGFSARIGNKRLVKESII